jgi:hypothetical protein
MAEPCEWCPNEDGDETYLIVIWDRDGSKRETWLCEGCYESLDWTGDKPPEGWLLGQ